MFGGGLKAESKCDMIIVVMFGLIWFDLGIKMLSCWSYPDCVRMCAVLAFRYRILNPIIYFQRKHIQRKPMRFEIVSLQYSHFVQFIFEYNALLYALFYA